MNQDKLREQWRVAAVEAAHADDKAARLRQGREIFLDELIETLIEQSEGDKRLSQAQAERMARTSEPYKAYLRRMHDARRAANLLQIECENKNRIYYESVSMDATARAEMRMTRA
jgi:hypothetical protein